MPSISAPPILRWLKNELAICQRKIVSECFPVRSPGLSIAIWLKFLKSYKKAIPESQKYGARKWQKNPTPQTLLDKIQTFNRLKIVSEWILHQFFKIFGEGVLPLEPSYTRKKKNNKNPHNSSHIIPCKWGENSCIIPHPIGFELTQNASFTSVFHQ